MVNWNDNFANDLSKDLNGNLEKAAIYLKDKVKMTLNKTGHPYISGRGKGIHYRNQEVSAPGEPPRKMLGNLQRSIAYEMENDTAYVGTNLDYGLYLEVGTHKMQARPWLRPTLEQEKDTLLKIVATGKR